MYIISQMLRSFHSGCFFSVIVYRHTFWRNAIAHLIKFKIWTVMDGAAELSQFKEAYADVVLA